MRTKCGLDDMSGSPGLIFFDLFIKPPLGQQDHRDRRHGGALGQHCWQPERQPPGWPTCAAKLLALISYRLRTLISRATNAASEPATKVPAGRTVPPWREP
jgi:hypothetical protein